MDTNINSGNEINAASMHLTWRHYWIVTVASLGQMIGTTVATVAGIIIPMLNILIHPELSSFMQGLIGAADLIGICIGSVIFGKLSDKYGYLLFFRLCPTMILVASIIAIYIPTIPVLTIALFIIGVGIGGEYSLDSNYVSELMPEKYRSTMVGVTKTASALGNIIAAGISFGLIMIWPKAEVWPRLLWIIAGMSALMIILRIKFYQSPGWLLSKGKIKLAIIAIKKFLGKNVTISLPTPSATSQQDKESNSQSTNLLSFLKNNGKRIILSGIPWACEGLGVYGIGVFLPILVMALGLEHFTAGEAPIYHVAASVRITLWISCIILPGFIMGLILIKHKEHITTIQIVGFLVSALALGILIPAYAHHWNKWIAIIAFMVFEFFLNMGPHLITYVLPPKIYSVSDRGLGVGLAAAIGKIGAVIGVFCIPLLLHAGGAELVLIVSAAVMILGGCITFAYRKIVD